MDTTGLRVIFSLTLLLNIYVTRLVVRDDYLSSTQKVLQTLIIWLLPALGAIFVWITYRAMQKTFEETASNTESNLSYGSYESSSITNGDAGGE